LEYYTHLGRARSTLFILFKRISYHVRLDPETFLKEPRTTFPTVDYLRITCHSRIGKASLSLAYFLRLVRNSMVGGNLFRSCVLAFFFFFLLFFSLFVDVLSVFHPCGRALGLVLPDPLILTLNRSMTKSNPNCEFCNSLARYRSTPALRVLEPEELSAEKGSRLGRLP
jgi:hypothetical protein